MSNSVSGKIRNHVNGDISNKVRGSISNNVRGTLAPTSVVIHATLTFKTDADDDVRYFDVPERLVLFCSSLHLVEKVGGVLLPRDASSSVLLRLFPGLRHRQWRHSTTRQRGNNGGFRVNGNGVQVVAHTGTRIVVRLLRD